MRKVERSLPHNHARITGCVEIEIQIVKQIVRLGMTLILRNPNFPIFGFTVIEVYKLWGEFFLTALVIVNLKPCPRFPEKTRWEVEFGVVPNMQGIRILPIGCILIVVRASSQGEGGVVHGSGVVINAQYAQVGLYVGPSISTPGAARVAVKSGGRLKILVTSNFRSGSDGG